MSPATITRRPRVAVVWSTSIAASMLAGFALYASLMISIPPARVR